MAAGGLALGALGGLAAGAMMSKGFGFKGPKGFFGFKGPKGFGMMGKGMKGFGMMGKGMKGFGMKGFQGWLWMEGLKSCCPAMRKGSLIPSLLQEAIVHPPL